MSSKILIAMLVIGLSIVINPKESYAQSCKKEITVNSSVSGTISSLPSLEAIVKSSISRVVRNWRVASEKKYGEKYIYLSRGECKCSVSNKNATIGDRVTVKCRMTSQPCDQSYIFMEDFRCEFD